MTNITLIGAGSVEFTRILLADLAEFPELAGSTITLHDINPERLDTAERISRYTIDATGAKLQLRAEIDRRAALDGAEFVVNEIQVGGFEATLRDFEIPKKILELNPAHPILKSLLTLEPESDLQKMVIEQILDSALLVEGLHPDPSSMVARMQDIIQAALKNT